jgi:hypothetical protein
MTKLPCQCLPSSRQCLSPCLCLASHLLCLFVCLVGCCVISLHLFVVSPRAATSHCAALRRRVLSRLAITSCHVVKSLLVVASHCIASHLVTLSHTHFVQLVVCPRISSRRCVPSSPPLARVIVASCRCIVSLHRVLSSRCVTSCCIASLLHFVYLVVALFIPACCPPSSHDVDVNAVVADLLPPQRLQRSSNAPPKMPAPRATLSHLPTLDCCVLINLQK